MNHLFGQLKLVQMPDDTCKLIGIMVSSPKLKGPNAEPAAAVQTTMEAAPAVVAAPEPAGAVEAGSGGGAVAGSFCVRESIRVRVIDKRCAGGMLYNKKGVVVDVSSAAASQLLVCGARLQAWPPCASPSCYHCALNCAQTQCDQAPRWHAAAAQVRQRGRLDDATNLL